MIDKIAKEFIEDLSWLSVEKPAPIIIVYGMRKIGVKEPTIDSLSYSPIIKKVFITKLFNEEGNWPVYIDVVDIYLTEELNLIKDSNTLKLLKDLISYLLVTICEQNAILSWCMFEGGFMNIDNLFNNWEIESTYAFCLPGDKPVFALGRQERKASSWKDKLTFVSSYISEKSRLPDVL